MGYGKLNSIRKSFYSSVYNRIIYTIAKLLKNARLNLHLLQIQVVIQTSVTLHLSHTAPKFVHHSYKTLFRALSYNKTLQRPKCKKFKVQISPLNFSYRTSYYHRTNTINWQNLQSFFLRIVHYQQTWS